MASDFSKKVLTPEKNLNNLTGAKFTHVDGSASLVTIVAAGTGARLLRVIVNTKGLSLNLRTGSRVIGTIGTAVPEGTYGHGVYCENGIQIDVGGSGGSVTVVYTT